ncbi:MAG: phosphatidate cytidylyltransferase [Helcococcus sp.]|nr:phosphatidate cytidylyltransferase [Helcococcus sp.]
MNDLSKRIITGVFVILFILIISLINKYVLLFGLAILSLASIVELNNALKRIGFDSLLNISLLFNIIFILLSNYIDRTPLLISIVIYFIFLFVIYVLKEDMKFESLLSNIFIFCYISIPYISLALIYDMRWVLFSFLISSVTDTFAYFTGTLFGKHKLIERLSPKKTIEGSIGGIIGSVLFTIVFVYIFKIEHSILIYLFAIVVSVLSQIGDLFASHIKRMVGIKDYSRILNSHGGVMDRFDSLLLIAPFIYLLDYLMRFVL